MSTQSSLNLKSQESGPVECLGQTFPSNEARREHYLNLLAEKLKAPEFRKIEGFPIGEDEDILAISDPPYYTACPNPWLEDFVRHYGTPYDPKKAYHREPFTADVSEGKTHPIYLAHSYHTKVPHRAIMRYILHYTDPGELVFDGFCGTGMTGVAAQLCGDRNEVQQLGYRVQQDGTILNEEGNAFSKLGARRAVLNDLSPAASFIASNYLLPFDQAAFEKEAQRILSAIESEMGWIYATAHTNGKPGRINFTVWSDVFTCPECGGEIVFWEDAVEDGYVKDEIQCSHCKASLRKRNLDRTASVQLNPDTGKIEKKPKRQPVLINYSFAGERYEKTPDKDDLTLVQTLAAHKIAQWYPTTVMERDSDLWMERDYTSLGIFSADGFYSRRNLVMCSFARDAIMDSPPTMRRSLWFWFQSVLMGFSLVNRYRAKGFSQVNQILSGTLYVGATTAEISPWYALSGKISRFKVLDFDKPAYQILSTASSSCLNVTPESLDYIFIDPPFGSN
ncbi:MAG: DNA methyltransferase, partial [Desulfomonile sp.]